ncbi:nucleotide sugar synthetase [Ligilactobacillus sp. UO.C109]|uniref:nucleotide sugar synthetase n=1 Tax=Ligilactobacillus sp. UO.C109 TaxID=3003264 RepID=UPI0022853DD7|nr:nucleotide sugar synthetase [Ligilactobacillus sp. UO.C109]MCZ0744116.1 nucleotide sugar synthetase [Ligilactobacillus sp. UO.C109]
MSRTHITNLYGVGGIATVAQRRTVEVAKQLGFNEISILYDNGLRDPEEFDKKVVGILAGLEVGDTVIFQSPIWITSKVERDFIDRVRQYQGKVAIFINDIPPMMFEGNRELMPLFIELYNKADLLIVPSENMKDYLISKGVTVEKFVIQNLWDIPVDFISNSETKYLPRINFAGSDEKFGITENINSNDIELEIYDHKPEDKLIPDNVHYHGYVDEVKLLSELHEGGFGLVWTEDMYWREYMKYNASYKVSTYLRAGIPLIVHRDISCRKLIEDNHWGIVVDSLEEAVERVKAMSEDEYRKYAESVSKVSGLLVDNYFTKKVLVDTLYEL